MRNAVDRNGLAHRPYPATPALAELARVLDVDVRRAERPSTTPRGQFRAVTARTSILVYCSASAIIAIRFAQSPVEYVGYCDRRTTASRRYGRMLIPLISQAYRGGDERRTVVFVAVLVLLGFWS